MNSTDVERVEKNISNPTIMNKAESNDHQSGKYAALIQQFKNLQVEWRSLQKSMSRSNPRSSDDNSILTSFDQITEKSPRSLMSNLQHRTSPNLLLRVKNPSCDVAVEEILRDRRAAIMTGKIKGRRLFQDSNGSGEISSDLLLGTMSQQRDVMMVNENICCRGIGGELHDEMSVDFDQPFSFLDNSLPPEEKAVVVEEEKMVVEKGGRGYVVSMAWFAFVLILVTLGLISMGCNGKFLQENELILVPT